MLSIHQIFVKSLRTSDIIQKNCFSVFHTEDWNRTTQWPDSPGNDVNGTDQEICWYRGLNEPEFPYERKDSWWHVFAARLAFVLAFQVRYFII